MSAPAFTPGPWDLWLDDRDGAFQITALSENHLRTNLVVVQRGGMRHRVEEAKANARLMAAAPDMHDALEPFARDWLRAGGNHLPDDAKLRDVDEFNDLTVGDMKRALAAYRKARGEQ